jgi:hypothetical protein
MEHKKLSIRRRRISPPLVARTSDGKKHATGTSSGGLGVEYR